MRVLVVGATGQLGAAVSRRLLDDGHQVRAMARAPSRAAVLSSAGAEVIRGDLTDHASIATAMEDIDAVIPAVHALLGRGANASDRVDDQGMRALVAAAARAEVKRFVYVSILGASANHPVDFWRTKYGIERVVQQSGIPYTIVRPGAYMETHAHDLLGRHILAKRKAPILGAGTARTNFVAVADVAQFVVLALSEPRLENRTVEFGGPENVSRNHVAALYGRVAGVTPRVSHAPAAVLRVLSVLARPLHPGVARVMRMGGVMEGLQDTLDMRPLLDEFPELSLTSLESFVRAKVAEQRGPVKPGHAAGRRRGNAITT